MTRCEVRSGARRGGILALAAGLFLCVAPVQAQQTTTPTVPAFLRLPDAIKIALQSSNILGVQQQRLMVAKKQRTNEWFNLGPDLNASGQWAKSTRKDYDIVVGEIPTDTRSVQTLEGDTLVTVLASTPITGDRTEKSNFKSGSLSSTIRLFDGFANYNRISAAGHAVNAQEHSVEYTEQQVTELVVQTYLDLLRAQLLKGVATEAETVARDQLDRTKSLYELGSAARSDVLKQQVQHDQTRLDLVKAEQLERQSKVDLEWAMNLSGSAPFQIDTTLTQLELKTTDFESERAYAAEHRQNLLSLREAEKASDKRVWVARGTLLPTVDFRYSIARTRTNSEFRFGGAENFNREWALFANWNIWDRYSNYVRIDAAKADSRIAEYDRRQAELDAIREVRQLVNSMDEARERLAVSRETVTSAREDLRLAQEKFRVGAGTILDTVVAESDLTRARANEVQAIVDYLISRARLARATGRPLSEV